jgi:3-oxoacyl-[acyl-carrier-protein] synthase-3
MGMRRSIIRGCGGYIPEQIVTNDDVSQWVETSHEWIVERTGIHSRRFAAVGEFTSDLATKAAQEALTAAELSPKDIDLIVVGTVTPDDTFPSTATQVQAKLGCKKGVAFDVAAACSGYLVALATADSFLTQGRAMTALVIGAETFSRIIDKTDRRTCPLFGDGAGAVVLQAVDAKDNPQDRGVLGVYLHSDGQYRDLLYTDGGPSTTNTSGYIRMEGQEVFRHAVTKLSEVTEEALQRQGFTLDQIDWLIPHQANIRIIEALGKKLNLPPERIIKTVDHHANTSAASIPLALHKAVQEQRLQAGDIILHEAIGAGLVWGSAVIRW